MNRTETLKTLNVLAAAALAVYFLAERQWLLYTAFALLLLNLADNPPARWLAAGWMKFAEILGAVNSRIILWLIFFFILTPVAFFYRLFNKQAAAHFTADPGGSLFEDIPADACSKESFEKTW
ncbi:MAG TPA: hypothetical protein DCZ92_13910 [Elusimicrobia bacterium]|nr:MAG: hypothetical protein A2016_05515 [Elusimicrobia bacterium GWF2_62_30]HBA61878.1 hypothetical protein [Elusimicrobiota bacterium]